MFDRVLAVALREYRAAVQTKAFLVSLLLMPLILAVSVGVQLFATTAEAGKTRTYAVVDRTARLREPLEQALSERSRENLHDPAKLALSGSFRLEFVEPSASARAAVLEQRLALTERHERGEIEGILEIGAAVFELPPAAFEDAEAAERHSVRFQSNKLIGLDFSRWSERAINDAVHTERLRARGISADLVRQLEVPVPLHVRAGTRKDPHTGQIEDASEVSRVASFFVP